MKLYIGLFGVEEESQLVETCHFRLTNWQQCILSWLHLKLTNCCPKWLCISISQKFVWIKAGNFFVLLNNKRFSQVENGNAYFTSVLSVWRLFCLTHSRIFLAQNSGTGDCCGTWTNFLSEDKLFGVLQKTFLLLFNETLLNIPFLIILYSKKILWVVSAHN